MEIIRHVAKVANTDQRCIVAYMQIPNREDHALVIPVDGLPPRIEQAIMQVLKTPEGQQEETFANALHRHRMPDSGDTILASLHKSGKLVPVPVANILMLPQPNKPIKLTYILEQLGRMPHQMNETANNFATEKFNPHINNQEATSTEGNRNIARGLLMEAEMLEAEARKKRDQAYSYDSSMRPLIGPSSQQASVASLFSMTEEAPAPVVVKASEPAMDEFMTRLDRIESMFDSLMARYSDQAASETETEAE